MRYMSPVMTGSSVPRQVQLDLRGANELGLFVHYGWDDYAHDHADWANARVTCTP